MSYDDHISKDQFYSHLYRSTPRLSESAVNYLLATKDPSKSTYHAIPREQLLEEAQKGINQYRVQRDRGPEGIEAKKAAGLQEVIKTRHKYKNTGK